LAHNFAIEKREIIESYMEEIRLKPDTNWDKVDPDLPVIFVTEGELKFPIDGRHRLVKGFKDGRPTIPVIYLTEAESAEVKMT